MKTFILCLGSQKCGTTWFHSYLSLYENFSAGFAKEYHVWDALDLSAQARWRVPQPGLFDVVTKRPAKRRRNRHLYKMQNETGYYFDYFNSLLTGPVNITADVTPAYAGLGADRLGSIRSGFEAIGVECKAVLFVREPVERDKSAVQFALENGNFEEGISPGNEDFCAALEEYYLSEHAAMRSSYHRTISHIEAVFDPGQFYIGVYENMFDQASVGALSEFIGVQPRYDFASVRVNETAQNAVSCPDLERRIRSHYAEVYSYCHDKLPATRTLWH